MDLISIIITQSAPGVMAKTVTTSDGSPGEAFPNSVSIVMPLTIPMELLMGTRDALTMPFNTSKLTMIIRFT